MCLLILAAKLETSRLLHSNKKPKGLLWSHISVQNIDQRHVLWLKIRYLIWVVEVLLFPLLKLNLPVLENFVELNLFGRKLRRFD